MFQSNACTKMLWLAGCEAPCWSRTHTKESQRVFYILHRWRYVSIFIHQTYLLSTWRTQVPVSVPTCCLTSSHSNNTGSDSRLQSLAQSAPSSYRISYKGSLEIQRNFTIPQNPHPSKYTLKTRGEFKIQSDCDMFHLAHGQQTHSTRFVVVIFQSNYHMPTRYILQPSIIAFANKTHTASSRPNLQFLPATPRCHTAIFSYNKTITWRTALYQYFPPPHSGDKAVQVKLVTTSNQKRVSVNTDFTIPTPTSVNGLQRIKINNHCKARTSRYNSWLGMCIPIPCPPSSHRITTE